MQHKKKPNLAGIQEFGVAAHIKDLKARKLDACAKVGWFIGYDLESKGYWMDLLAIKMLHHCWVQYCIQQKQHNFQQQHPHYCRQCGVWGERNKVLQPPATNVPNCKSKILGTCWVTVTVCNPMQSINLILSMYITHLLEGKREIISDLHSKWYD